MMTSNPCTCQWSTVNTATIDPPYIEAVDPWCPRHGIEASDEDEDDDYGGRFVNKGERR